MNYFLCIEVQMFKGEVHRIVIIAISGSTVREIALQLRSKKMVTLIISNGIASKRITSEEITSKKIALKIITSKGITSILTFGLTLKG